MEVSTAQTVFSSTSKPDIEEIQPRHALPGVSSTAAGIFAPTAHIVINATTINLAGTISGTGRPTVRVRPGYTFTGAASVAQTPTASSVGLFAVILTLASGILGMMMVLL